jgi:hypothetical protein
MTSGHAHYSFTKDLPVLLKFFCQNIWYSNKNDVKLQTQQQLVTWSSFDVFQLTKNWMFFLEGFYFAINFNHWNGHLKAYMNNVPLLCGR